MSSHNNAGGDNARLNPERKPDEISSHQQEALFRIFLYLKALHVPEEKARELASETLQRAGKNNRDFTLTEVMGTLRVLLKNQLPLITNVPYGQNNAFLETNLSGLKSMPPVNRGFMVPSAIDLIPWRTSFVRSLKKAVATLARPLNILILFVLLIIVFVLLAFWK